MSIHFGNGAIQPNDLATSLKGAIVKDEAQDQTVWQEYLETVLRRRAEWKELYEACKGLER
jgi:hypothetical protein